MRRALSVARATLPFVAAYRSTDAGRTWTLERTVIQPPINGRQIVCDPSLVAGAGLFVFKTG